MNKYKVCVYAICKNEEQFVDRFVDSAKEADEIYVLDTGSTDDTVKKLKKRGVKVKIKEIKPWRFDVARNMSLKLLPKDTDICVCIDLDEVLEKGWRKELEKIWTKDMNKLRYNYNWSFDNYGNPAVNFYIEKIHDLKNYEWTHPVHEVLTFKGKNEVSTTTDKITVNHYPDNNKPRSSYLPLLELSVKEDPLDDRNIHYLGREYMYYGKWNEAIDTLIKHLALDKATWKDERSTSMRFIGRCYIELKRYKEAEMWFKESIMEAPYMREGYIELAKLYTLLENHKQVINYLTSALKINTKNKSYINEPFSWDATIDDMLSISYYYIDDYKKSLEHVNLAIEKDPNNERLMSNKEIIQNKLEN